MTPNTIKKISLIHFRNYDSASYEFNAPITCITGLNGTGKTNLLDAIYYLCYTKSYFTAYQQNIKKHGTDGFRVEGIFNDNEKQELISCKWQNGKKEISADGTEYKKITDHIGKYSAVMIAPDDMELINDGSELRRKWIDSILSQTDKEYLERLLQYQQVLLQRNAWLKLFATNPPNNNAALEFYNNQLAAHGNYIYEQRRTFIEQFTPLLNDYYRPLSGGREVVNIVYKSDLQQQSFIYLLEKGLEHDIRYQRTLKGIHKDDLEFSFNNLNLKQFGSQGQKKSYLFALKLAQFNYLQTILGKTPVLLLDDIFEKLDQRRMEALLHIIQSEGFGQVLLTDTHAERILRVFSSKEKTVHIML